jgi:hypothetical protein
MVCIASTIVFLFGSAPIAAQIKGGRGTRQSTSTEISDRDWNQLSGALAREDWDLAARTSDDLLRSLKIENDKKQVAQLRYLHLFALAGRISRLIVGKNETAAGPAWEELENTAVSYRGQELMMPARSFSISCAGKVNFVCPIRDDRRALRVSSTNINGDFILAFEYYSFVEDIDLRDFEARKVFLVGKLDRFEFNQDDSKPWIMRLFIKSSAARIAIGG